MNPQPNYSSLAAPSALPSPPQHLSPSPERPSADVRSSMGLMPIKVVKNRSPSAPGQYAEDMITALLLTQGTQAIQAWPSGLTPPRKKSRTWCDNYNEIVSSSPSAVGDGGSRKSKSWTAAPVVAANSSSSVAIPAKPPVAPTSSTSCSDVTPAVAADSTRGSAAPVAAAVSPETPPSSSSSSSSPPTVRTNKKQDRLAGALSMDGDVATQQNSPQQDEKKTDPAALLARIDAMIPTKEEKEKLLAAPSSSSSGTGMGTSSLSSSSPPKKDRLAGVLLDDDDGGNNSSNNNASKSAAAEGQQQQQAASRKEKVSSPEQQAFMDAIVGYHNAFRSRHGAPPLEWDADCEASAAKCAAQCSEKKKMEHAFLESLVTKERHGQNIYWHSKKAKPDSAATTWYNERFKPGWDFSKPDVDQPGTGHFTQLVWKGSKKVGAAVSPCGKYLVANYYPGGNFRTKYADNVLPSNDGT